jgi:hypothetical protein
MKPKSDRRHTNGDTRHATCDTSMVAVALICACAAAACTSPRTRAAWARPYPEAPTLAGTADIQVIREGTRISMTNTTAREFGPSTVWINMQWSLPVEGFRAGQTLTLDLAEFRNEHHERFRAGGFFATERPDVIALTQVETPRADGRAEFVGLVTVKGVE